MGVVVALLLILIGAWMYREYTEARERKSMQTAQPVRSTPPPPPHQRVTDRELDEQVKALRQAIEEGAVTEEEAVGSLVRTAGLPADEARKRLRH